MTDSKVVGLKTMLANGWDELERKITLNLGRNDDFCRNEDQVPNVEENAAVLKQRDEDDPTEATKNLFLCKNLNEGSIYGRRNSAISIKPKKFTFLGNFSFQCPKPSLFWLLLLFSTLPNIANAVLHTLPSFYFVPATCPCSAATSVPNTAVPTTGPETNLLKSAIKFGAAQKRADIRQPSIGRRHIAATVGKKKEKGCKGRILKHIPADPTQSHVVLRPSFALYGGGFVPHPSVNNEVPPSFGIEKGDPPN